MNTHPEPGLPSERAVTERLAAAVVDGRLTVFSYPCDVCGSRLTTLGGLEDHMVTVHNYADPWSPKRETITAEAERLVLGDRQDDYGHPADDFARTGRIWAAILGVDQITPEQVALCMVGVKLSREVNLPKRDNRVDAIGYMLTAELIHQRAEQ